MKNLQRRSLKMPHKAIFLCFEDNEARIFGRINWREDAIVDSIDFLMVGRQENLNLKIGFVANCGGESNTFGMALVMDEDYEGYSTYHMPVRGIDLSKGNSLEFIYGVFRDNPKPTEEELCDAISIKPRTRDGHIIISI